MISRFGCALKRSSHYNAIAYRSISDVNRVYLNKSLESIKDATLNPTAIIEVSTLVDDLSNVVRTADDAHKATFEKWLSTAQQLSVIANDRPELADERSADETRQERNSEVLGIAGACLFGVFSVAIHPIFLVPFGFAARSLKKTQGRETFREQAIFRIEEINVTLTQNLEITVNELTKMNQELDDFMKTSIAK